MATRGAGAQSASRAAHRSSYPRFYRCGNKIHPHIHDNWQSDALRKCLPRGYDEERRLLYVAITRAENHLIFSAGENPNTFIEELPVDIDALVPDVQEADTGETTQSRLQVSVPTPEGPVGQSPHSLMRDDVFDGVDEGRGAAFVFRTHEFAEQYARGDAVEPTNDDEAHITEFIDSLDGNLQIEADVYLPLTVDGERVTISGIVDLVHVRPETVEIIDFKTDLGRHAETEYRKQLSIYYHVLSKWFPDRDVSAAIFYTTDGTQVDIDPLSQAELVDITKEVIERQDDDKGEPAVPLNSANMD